MPVRIGEVRRPIRGDDAGGQDEGARRHLGGKPTGHSPTQKKVDALLGEAEGPGAGTIRTYP